MSLNLNLFSVSDKPGVSSFRPPEGTVSCPNCTGDVTPLETERGRQSCPFCQKQLQIWFWPAIRQNTSSVAAMPDQATCFFHPEKAFQACCQRCGRFVCALCDLQLGAEHVCPTCFERGRTDLRRDGSKAEWRNRDVLYDSIAVALGWGWIIVWPVIVVAFPAAIFLHVKYRKAPRSYLLPRSGWRFWAAYVGFAWLPMLLFMSIYLPRWIAGRH